MDLAIARRRLIVTCWHWRVINALKCLQACRSDREEKPHLEMSRYRARRNLQNRSDGPADIAPENEGPPYGFLARVTSSHRAPRLGGQEDRRSYSHRAPA